MNILETDRLVLRKIEPGDAAALSELWCDPDVTRFMGGPRDYEVVFDAFSEEAQDPLPAKFDLWPVVEKATGNIVGHCGLLDKEIEEREEIELIYVLAKSAWGKGYATEIARAISGYAFISFGLKQIVCLIEPENKNSENVAKKIGMRYVNTVKRTTGKLMKLYRLEQLNFLR